MVFRWGIAGYGWVAQQFVTPAIAAAGHRLVAISEPSLSAAARRPRGVRWHRDIAGLLDETLDALYVATPNDAHRSIVEEAARMRLPTLCEKPMAATLSDAEAMARSVNESATIYGTAFDQRWHPAHRAIAQLLAESAVGRVSAIRIVYACWVDRDWSGATGPNWRADQGRAGGGAVIDLALHGLDLAEMLLGEPIADLRIALQQRIHDYEVEDGGLVIGRSGSGVLFQAHVAYNCPEVFPRRRLEVVGEHGLIIATDTMGQTAGGALTLCCGRTGESRPIHFDVTRSPFTSQIQAFARAVKQHSHDFSIKRDLGLMRRFSTAYEEARACL